MKTPLTEQDLLELAMSHVGRDLQDLGLEIIDINSTKKRQPQFICKDDNSQQYFVVVNAVKLPFNPYRYNVVLMELFKIHATQNNAKLLYAGVGLGNAKDESLPLYMEQDYLLKYTGLQSVEFNLN